MYMYRCPCSFNTMPQLINPSDEPVTLQPWTRRFLLVTDLVNVQPRVVTHRDITCTIQSAVNARTRGDRDAYPAPIPLCQVMGEYDDDEYTLPMCVPHDAAKLDATISML
ncbi:hypothetical protein TNCV_2108551 [Trichonephila clavipes]|nr:hypothetical protein TNCV_2108551 [Trichonephila clavipes]